MLFFQLLLSFIFLAKVAADVTQLPKLDFQDFVSIMSNHSNYYEVPDSDQDHVTHSNIHDVAEVEQEDHGNSRQLNLRGPHANAINFPMDLNDYYSINYYSDAACRTAMSKFFFRVNQCVSYAEQPGTFVMLRLYWTNFANLFQNDRRGVLTQYSDSRCTKGIRVIEDRPMNLRACNRVRGGWTGSVTYQSLQFPSTGNYAVIALYTSPQQCRENKVSLNNNLVLGIQANRNSCWTTPFQFDIRFGGCDANGNMRIVLVNQVAGRPCTGSVIQISTVRPTCNTLSKSAVASAFSYAGYGNIFCRR